MLTFILTGEEIMKSLWSKKKDSHTELAGDCTSTSPSKSNLSARRFKLGGVRLVPCSIVSAEN